MASALSAAWEALEALYAADTGAGGLAETAGDNALHEFLLERGTKRARNTPSVYVEVESLSEDTFGNDASRVLVRMHLFTDMNRDAELARQWTLADRMTQVFDDADPADDGTTTFNQIRKRREFNAPSQGDQAHLVQEYTMVVSH